MYNSNKFLFIFLFISLSGCSSLTEYLSDLTAPDREDLVVYKRDSKYQDTQFDLEVPPDLISPIERKTLDIPDFVKNNEAMLFTVDTKLEDIELIRNGRDSMLSLKNTDKKILWDKLISFWRTEGFGLSQRDYTLGTIKTVYLENLSEAQLGTIQKYVGRYIPLLVSPETRDSFKTRILEQNDKINILVTHYGKEYMSDGETEFRWQNRPRDPEIESEMLSRLYIYLGGEEAKARGYNVVKTTGLRNKASLNIDENGIHTLFVSDIYERVWPQTIRTLETIGVQLLNTKESDGVIFLSAQEVDSEEDDSAFSFLTFWRGSTNTEQFNLIISENQDGVTIEVQDANSASFTNIASEEVMRALYADFR